MKIRFDIDFLVVFSKREKTWKIMQCHFNSWRISIPKKFALYKLPSASSAVFLSLACYENQMKRSLSQLLGFCVCMLHLVLSLVWCSLYLIPHTRNSPQPSNRVRSKCEIQSSNTGDQDATIAMVIVLFHQGSLQVQ